MILALPVLEAVSLAVGDRVRPYLGSVRRVLVVFEALVSLHYESVYQAT